MAKGYFLQILIAADQTVNAVLGGYADETFSSRSHRWWQEGSPLGFFRYLINALFFWQKDHCKDAFLSERGGRHLPPEMRDPD